MFFSLKFQPLSWPQVDHALTSTYRWYQMIANAIGILICFLYFIFFEEVQPWSTEWQTNLTMTIVLSAALMIIGVFSAKLWMKDIRRYVAVKINDLPVSAALEKKCKQKIINLPLFSAAISMLNWSVAAIVMPFFISIGPDRFIMGLKIDSFLWVSLGIGMAGAATGVIVFFVTEIVCKPIWGKFFPAGELIQINGVFRLNLWQRILIIFLMASLFPLIDLAVVSYQKAQLMSTHDPSNTLESLMFMIFFLLAVELSLVIVLSNFMSRSIVAPVKNLKKAMNKVAEGDFKTRVKVVDNNELGALSLHFNQMTEGLKERYELLKTLSVAKEVQQNLLPDQIPEVQGLDMAGKSIFCDQTGGDYYDFIDAVVEGEQVIVTAVGDVSGHGIPSALLMASARAFLRQRLAVPGSMEEILNDVNAQFC